MPCSSSVESQLRTCFHHIALDIICMQSVNTLIAGHARIAFRLALKLYDSREYAMSDVVQPGLVNAVQFIL